MNRVSNGGAKPRRKEHVMITIRRVLGTPVATLPAAALAASLFLAGCASDTAPNATPDATAAASTAAQRQPASLAHIKSELIESKSQLQMTTDSLNKLQRSSTADAQANYNAFTEQYVKLKAKSDALRARAEDLRKKASAYYAMWNRQVEVENPDLRRQALQQKTNAEQTYNDIKSEMELARLAFEPYMSNLKDIGNYLRGNVNPGTLNSIGDLVKKANDQSKEVNSHIDAIVSDVDKIAGSTGEGVTGGGGGGGGGATGAAGTAGGAEAPAPPAP
jgi:hypothetical protein